MFYLLYLIFILPILILLPTKIVGRKNLPKKGNFIFTCNHGSNWDAIIIEARIHKKFFILGKAELFKNKLLGWLLRSCHAYPVVRGGNDIDSVKYTLRTLKDGKRSLLIFPEGTRAKTDEYMDIKNGSAMFALKTNKDIVPAVFVRKNRLFRRNTLIIGNSYNLANELGVDNPKIDKELLNRASEIIANKMLELKNNYYKEHNKDAK